MAACVEASARKSSASDCPGLAAFTPNMSSDSIKVSESFCCVLMMFVGQEGGTRKEIYMSIDAEKSAVCQTA